MLDIVAVGRSRGPSLPPFVQRNTRRLERRESLIPSSTVLILTPVDPKTNVLIDNDGHARLTDFGLTSIILGNKSVVSFQDDHLTMATMWMAPEISEGGVVTKEGDVFTFAMVAVEVWTGAVLDRGF